MQQRTRYMRWGGLFLTLLLTVLLTSRSAQAECVGSERDFCSDSAAYQLIGHTGAIEGRTSSPGAEQPSIAQPMLPAAGALIYTDYVDLEARARTLLRKAMTLRESISPYQDNNNFENHLRKLNAEAGWEDKPFDDTTDIRTPDYESAATFADLAQQLEADLTKARTLYAFLAVFAPETRFRQDAGYINNDGANSLCGAEDKEDPNPQPNPAEPIVAPPVIDWCNFQARLQQSVREVAYVRMIVGQEFMVDALGVNFSSGFIGGDAIVEEELAQLRAARYQFEQAERWLREGLTITIGNGCLVSDFYTLEEWRLLTGAAERQGTAQFHIATRESYLNISSPQSNTRAATEAQTILRQSANDAHIKLIGLAALGAPAAKPHCAL
ncbi:MAG: hypothetical protein KDE31_33815, partial [Caldilineaceae bacterium]|nr:hypothetical protein [Caldilineaceae bacterium]